MPRSAFAFPGEELCGALQGVIAYLVMWTRGAEARATSTATALGQGIWTSLWSHTQVRHKSTPAYIHRCARACAHEGDFEWKKERNRHFYQMSCFSGKQQCAASARTTEPDFLGGLWWNESRCPTSKQGIKVLISYKKLFRNNPQAKIKTVLLCTATCADIALTLVLRQLLLRARVFMSDVWNKQAPPSPPHLWTNLFKG